MTSEELDSLIQQNEHAKLDFKSKWYWDNETPKQVILKQKLELYKDIIAMTNGNIHYIGQPTYLVIGVKEGTPNKICNVKFDVISLEKDIVQGVNNYATPLIQGLTITKHSINDENEEKTIYVIKIPPHPFPIILKQDLKGLERKGTLLIRAGEGAVVVGNANYETRKSFEEQIEKFYNKEKDNKRNIEAKTYVENINNTGVMNFN